MDIDESRYGALPNLGGVPAVGLGAWEEIKAGRSLGTCMNSLVVIWITWFRDSGDIGRGSKTSSLNRSGDKRTIIRGTRN